MRKLFRVSRLGGEDGIHGIAEWRKKLDAATMLVSGTFAKKGIDGAPVMKGY